MYNKMLFEGCSDRMPFFEIMTAIPTTEHPKDGHGGSYESYTSLQRIAAIKLKMCLYSTKKLFDRIRKDFLEKNFERKNEMYRSAPRSGGPTDALLTI